MWKRWTLIQRRALCWKFIEETYWLNDFKNNCRKRDISKTSTEKLNETCELQKSFPQHDTWQVIFILSSSLAPSARLLQGGKKLLEHSPLATHPRPNHVVFWPEFSWDTSYLKCTQRASSIAQSTVVAFAAHSSYDLLLLHLLQIKLFAAKETKVFKNWEMYQNEGKMKGKNGNRQLSISQSFTFANNFERFISFVF